MATKEGLGWFAGLATAGLVATSASKAKVEKEAARFRAKQRARHPHFPALARLLLTSRVGSPPSKPSATPRTPIAIVGASRSTLLPEKPLAYAVPWSGRLAYVPRQRLTATESAACGRRRKHVPTQPPHWSASSNSKMRSSRVSSPSFGQVCALVTSR